MSAIIEGPIVITDPKIKLFITRHEKALSVASRKDNKLKKAGRSGLPLFSDNWDIRVDEQIRYLEGRSEPVAQQLASFLRMARDEVFTLQTPVPITAAAQSKSEYAP